MKHTTKQPQADNEDGRMRNDSEAFVLALNNAEFMSPLYIQLCRRFGHEMDKAIKGRILTPGRMIALCPIFREINIETDELDAEYQKEEAKAAKRTKKAGAL